MSNSEYYNPNHTSEALDLLLYQFRNSTNLRALLSAYTDRVQEFEDAVDPILNAFNLETATGDRLDKIGQIVDESRQGRTDDVYRIVLKVKVLVLKSTGTPNELICILQALSGTTDVWYREYYPYSIYLRAQFLDTNPSLVSRLLRRAKPAARKLVYIYSSSVSESSLFKFAGSGVTGANNGFGNGQLAFSA